jgi:hypothetical protein
MKKKPPTSPEDITVRLDAIKSSTLLCWQTIANLPPVPLPPGSYFRKGVETALIRSLQNTDQLIQIVEVLMESSDSDFWKGVKESARHIKGMPHWYKAGITINSDVFETYEPEKKSLVKKLSQPLPLVKRLSKPIPLIKKLSQPIPLIRKIEIE